MKKKLALFLTVLSLCSYGQKIKKTHWEKMNLFDKVGFIEEYQECGKMRHLYSFNEKGDLVKEEIYESDGHLKEESVYKYLSEGYQKEVLSYTDDGALKSKEVYRYNEYGAPVDDSPYVTMQYYPTTRSEYDENGNEIVRKKYDGTGFLYEKIIFKYDEKNNETESVIHNYNTHTEQHRTNQYVFDKLGNWISKKEFFEDKLIRVIKRNIEYFQQ